MKNKIAIILCALLVSSSFSGCAKAPQDENVKEPVSDADVEKMDFEYSKGDMNSGYNVSESSRISFGENGAEVTGAGVTAKSTEVTVTTAGTYIFSGKCDNGRIIVDAEDADKIKLVFDGLSLSCANAPAVYVKNADKVFITLAEDSTNTVSDGKDYTATDGTTELDGAIFSKADLSINGNGTLTVCGNTKHAIVSKDDIVITGGVIDITSVKVGINGKDCVKIGGGTVTVNAGTDGIRSANDSKSYKGFVSITGGEVKINAGSDGIQAHTYINIDGGDIEITSGGGSANASMKEDGSLNKNWGKGWGSMGGQGKRSADAEDGTSAKGLKSSGHIMISDGKLTVDSSDDGLHANGYLTVNGGDTVISSGDDGAHAGTDLSVYNGNLSVLKSYEGIEGNYVGISGGNVIVISADDGLNAAGGADNSGFNGRPGKSGFDTSETSLISVSGGYVYINAGGDGIDSNGYIKITGGTTLISGPTTNMNGAVDYGISATVTGGVFIATGSLAMAENFSSAENQGAALINVGNTEGGTPIAICDENGCAIVTFTPEKQYQTAVISAPEIVSGRKYAVVTGGKAENADTHGFARNTTVTGGTTAVEFEMKSELYGGKNPGGMKDIPGGGKDVPPGGMEDVPGKDVPPDGRKEIPEKNDVI